MNHPTILEALVPGSRSYHLGFPLLGIGGKLFDGQVTLLQQIEIDRSANHCALGRLGTAASTRAG
jgi:hypothetical protein